MQPGTSMRANAMAAAGMVLSHPTRMTTPSRQCPRTASSMESAMVSREISEARMPSEPIEMPSETTTVLKSTGWPPASVTASRTGPARSARCMLQGVTVVQVLTTPIIGLSKSPSSIPVARSMARAAARAGPLVIASDVLFQFRVIELSVRQTRKTPLRVPGAGFFVSAFGL